MINFDNSLKLELLDSLYFYFLLTNTLCKFFQFPLTKFFKPHPILLLLKCNRLNLFQFPLERWSVPFYPILLSTNYPFLYIAIVFLSIAMILGWLIYNLYLLSGCMLQSINKYINPKQLNSTTLPNSVR